MLRTSRYPQRTKQHGFDVRAREQVVCLVDVMPVRQQQSTAHVAFGAALDGPRAHRIVRPSPAGPDRSEPSRLRSCAPGESCLSCGAVLPAPGRPRKLAEPRLPAQRGPAEEPVVRAVQHRTLTAVRVDAKIDLRYGEHLHARALHTEPRPDPRLPPSARRSSSPSLATGHP